MMGGHNSSDYLASIKDDLIDEEVFVFTPNWDCVQVIPPRRPTPASIG
jgi:(p)ppGpp synthase/HD superfamily hydrolase